MIFSKYIGGWKSLYKTLEYMVKVGPLKSGKSIFSKNTCKTCAYGMGGSDGVLKNEAGDSIQICKKSVQAQLTDIQAPINVDFITKTPLEKLSLLTPRVIEKLGRLDQILFKKDGDLHFSTLNMPEALSLVCERMMACDPNRSFFYSSGRSSNEAAFILQLFARLYGTNNVNNCSYYCHQASGVGLSQIIGTTTATIDLKDLKSADLIFVIGANPSSNHPRFLTELMECRRRGGHVVIINPVKEPGLVRFSIPSDVRSMTSMGSDIASIYLQPKIGCDIHVLSAIAKKVIENHNEDSSFIQHFTNGFDDYHAALNQMDFKQLCTESGVSEIEVMDVAAHYVQAKNVVFTWAMGITHHTHGVENVESIANLAMLRGMIGRPNAGLLPLRGHSNVQGVGSVGVSPTLKQSIFENIESQLQIALPKSPGWDTMACMREADAGNVDVAWIMGGNLYASNPNLTYAENALNKIKTKIYLTTTLNDGHLVPTEGEIIIFPVLARDEEMQTTTQESMFNYIRMSDGGIKRMQNARSETEIIVNVASVLIDSKVFDFSPFILHKNIRKAIAKTVAGFEKIGEMNEKSPGFHLSGRTKHVPTFDTDDGKAKFVIPKLPTPQTQDENEYLLMSVRSEGQFNSVIYEETDSWRGASKRTLVFMNPLDMEIAKIIAGDFVEIESSVGKLENYEVLPFDIARGCVMGYYPETNRVVVGKLDKRSQTPAFKNTLVRIKKMK
ncbi:MAG TPA: FdhF/YdeP family oxidoreductase [Saprospiraceae bacterium]|nr:FdhF/YdeP family oxidoreductase [Saprospiraceae bacterium]